MSGDDKAAVRAYSMKIPGIKAVELAGELRIAPQTVYNWKALPGYADAYLKLREENKRLSEEVIGLKKLLRG